MAFVRLLLLTDSKVKQSHAKVVLEYLRHMRKREYFFLKTDLFIYSNYSSIYVSFYLS